MQLVCDLGVGKITSSVITKFLKTIFFLLKDNLQLLEVRNLN